MSKMTIYEMMKMIAKTPIDGGITTRDLFAVMTMHALLIKIETDEYGGRDQERTIANLAYDFADEAMSIRDARYHHEFSCSSEA